jgi:hypothetical protein
MLYYILQKVALRLHFSEACFGHFLNIYIFTYESSEDLGTVCTHLHFQRFEGV